MRQLLLICFLSFVKLLVAQTDSLTTQERDSLYIFEVQDKYEKDKVLHAEPLYIDLIRDLGARKGEREWNIGYGMVNHEKYDSFEALIEYEWAPMDRLGLEVEVPVVLYRAIGNISEKKVPQSKIESLKLATQWSFFVNESIATSMALGYIHEFEFSPFKNFGKPVFEGQVFNPFFIAAKRWGNNFHTLIYTGPYIQNEFATKHLHTGYEMHTNFHYMIPGTRNFIGIEVNKYFEKDNVDITLRPQMRVAINDNFLIGIVPSIPIQRTEDRMGMFLRVIWEPRDHHTR